MNKPEMRRAMQGFLGAMSAADLASRSAKVAQRLQETGAWMWMDTLLSFLSMPREIGTQPISGRLARRGNPWRSRSSTAATSASS